MLRSTCITRWRVFPQCVVIGVIASMALTPLALAATDDAVADAIADTVTPITSPYDSRDYRVLTLENGLNVLLVSDPEADKAAASMNVRVGSAQDPDDLKGLAHFLEHMLFLGTEPSGI